MMVHGIVTTQAQSFWYYFHFGRKSVFSHGMGDWSTLTGNWDECPTFVRNAIQADIKAKEVERCIRGV